MHDLPRRTIEEDALGATPWTVTKDEIPQLIEEILNPGRLHSLTVISPAGDTGRPRIDVDQLVREVEHLPTDVVVLDSMPASERLSDSISSTFHCYGGSVRVVMPDARVTDHFRRHPLLLIYPEDDPGASLRRVVEAVEHTPHVAPQPTPARPPRVLHTGTKGRIPAGLVPGTHTTPKPGPPTGAKPDSSPRPEPAAQPAGPQPPTPAHTPFGLADIETVVARSLTRVLEEQFGSSSEDTERERSRADTAEELLHEAEQRITRLEDELRAEQKARREIEERGQLPFVSDDPVEQLRSELAWYWLVTVTGDAGPMPTYTLGAGLVTGLDHAVVPRRRTLEVIVGLMRDDDRMLRRTHDFLESKGGRPRLTDAGHRIRRTAIREHTPQAPRLTWWRTDAGFHFDHVGPHDELL